MPVLKSLSFTALPKAANDPVQLRRVKFVAKLEEQKLLLKDPNHVRGALMAPPSLHLQILCTLFALVWNDVIGDLVAFTEVVQAGLLNSRNMDEHILIATAIRRDETIPLSRVEPLHSTCRHVRTPFEPNGNKPRSVVGGTARIDATAKGRMPPDGRGCAGLCRSAVWVERQQHRQTSPWRKCGRITQCCRRTSILAAIDRVASGRCYQS